MRQLIKFLRLFSLLTLLSFSSYAQPQFKIFDSESGLSSNSVTSIIQDKIGYLWIGTTDGLNRFDGYSFKIFRHNPKDDNSMAHNVIYALAVDKLNRIWIGHRTADVTCYDPAKNKFTRYRLFGDSTVNGISFINVGRDKMIWIGAAGHGVVVLNPETGSVRKIDLSPYINKGYYLKDYVNYNTANAIYEGKGSMVWLATSDGLYKYDKKTNVLKPLRVVKDGPGEQRDDYFTGIVNDTKEGLWLSSNIGGISHYDLSSGLLKTFKYSRGQYDNVIGDLAWKNDNQFWVSTRDRGLGVFDISTKTFSFFKNSDILAGDNKELIWGRLFSDQANVLWACSTAGLVMIQERNNSCVFKSIYENKTPYDVNDIVDDQRTEKKIFATSFGPGLLISNKNETNWRFFECRKNSLYPKFNIVQDLLNEEGDSLWVVSRDNVRLFDKIKERWIDIPQLQRMESHITPSFFKIIKASSGDYWIASYRTGGYRVMKSDLGVTNFAYNREIKNSICSNYVTALAEDKLGRIWFGTSDKGISVYDPHLDRFITLGNDIKADFSSLPSNSVSALTSDENGDIWGASTHSGVFKAVIIGKDSLRVETFDNDLLSSPATDILADAKGRIWFSGYTEVHVLSPKSMQVKTFGKKDGLSSTTHQFIKDQDRVIVSGVNGYYLIDEHDLIQDTSSMPLVINSFKVFGKEMSTSEKDEGRINLEYDQSSIAIDYSAIDFSNNNNNNIRYSYKLEGVGNSVWSPPSTNRSTEFAHLIGGDYIFKLKATNHDGVWGKEKDLLYIHIGTPFWKATWFYGVVSVLLIALVFSLYTFQVAKIRNEARERSLTNEKMSQLQLKALYAQMSPHFIFNCLSAINGYIVGSETIKASEFLTKFSKLMRMILENSTDSWITLEKEVETLKLYLSMEELRFEEKFLYRIEIEEGIPAASFLIPSMICQPYVENAIWHGLLHKEKGRGMVSVNFFQDGNNIKCIIEDNGIGREKSNEIKNQSRGKSFGLQIISERLQLMHESSSTEIQDLVDESGQPAGTRITVILITKKIETNDKIHFNRR